MKYAVAAALLAAIVKAQTIDDVPSCAVPCLDDAIKSETDCDTTDYACVCANFDAIRGVATTCVIDECGPEVALNEVLPAVEALCAAQGGGDEPTATEEEPTMEPTMEPTKEPTMTEEPTMEPTETAIETTVQTTLTTTVCDHGCGETTHTPIPIPTGNGTIPEQPPNAAGALAPIGGLLLAVAAFAL